MQSKTSFCNGTILKKNLTRFAPLWLLYTLGLLLISTLMYLEDGQQFWFANRMGELIQYSGLINLFYAPAVAILLFGDLYNSKLCYGLHALPMKRSCWYRTHILSGLLFSLIPTAIMCGLAIPLLTNTCVVNGWQIGAWTFLGMNLTYLCFFGIAVVSCSANWLVALVAIAVVVVCNIWGKGMIKIIPILMGVVVSYIVAAVTNNVDFSAVKEAAWIGLPFQMQDTLFGLFAGEVNTGLLLTAVVTIAPLSLATMTEHIGDMCAISSTVDKNFVEDPGLHRTLVGDGLATTMASLFGAPANTTYGENTGVLALSKVYDPRVIRLAAIFAIVFSFCPKFAALIVAMPTATMGGVSMVLYGMISAVGVRNVVENQVDFTKSRNVIIAALIIALALGINFSSALGCDTAAGVSGAVSFMIGNVKISLSGLAVASLVGIILNAVLPGNDYKFGKNDQGDQSVNFKV